MARAITTAAATMPATRAISATTQKTKISMKTTCRRGCGKIKKTMEEAVQTEDATTKVTEVAKSQHPLATAIHQPMKSSSHLENLEVADLISNWNENQPHLWSQMKLAAQALISRGATQPHLTDTIEEVTAPSTEVALPAQPTTIAEGVTITAEEPTAAPETIPADMTTTANLLTGDTTPTMLETNLSRTRTTCHHDSKSPTLAKILRITLSTGPVLISTMVRQGEPSIICVIMRWTTTGSMTTKRMMTKTWIRPLWLTLKSTTGASRTTMKKRISSQSNRSSLRTAEEFSGCLQTP